MATKYTRAMRLANLNGRPCPYCKRIMNWDSPTLQPSRDHKIPVSRGGKNGDNVIWCCFQCNQAKGNMTDREYLDWLDTVTAQRCWVGRP